MKARIILLILVHIAPMLLQAQPSIRAREIWSKPKRVWSIFAAGGGSWPTLSKDERTLYYQDALVYGEVMQVEKTDTGWGVPKRLPPRINSFGLKSRPIIGPDGKTFYFSTGNTLMRSFWDSTLNDWGQPAPLTDNGISYPTGGPWHVCNFLNDTTMILLDYWDARLTSFDRFTGKWRKPRRFPHALAAFWWSGLFIPEDTMKIYEGGNNDLFANNDFYISYFDKTYGVYGDSYRLNLSYESDSLKELGEYTGNQEEALFLTRDGKTMYFGANYHGEYTIYESHLVINDQGDSVLAVESQKHDVSPLPEDIRIIGNYPNPFNPCTIIRYHLGTKEKILLCVYDVLGRVVAELFRGEQMEGEHEVLFAAKNLSSGIYMVQLEAGHKKSTAKLNLMK